VNNLNKDKFELECFFCSRQSGQVPLLNFEYQGKSWQVCAQHLPILIHEPQKLVGKLPGSENLSAAESDH